MKNLIFAICSVSLGLATSLNSLPTRANVIDFSQCSANSSFAIVTQSEGPTYACGGLDTGVGNPINILNGNKFEAINDFKELPAFKGLSFSRFYNSQSHADTALGYGWYSSFDIKLYEQPDIIQIRLESGQRINFKKNKIPLGNNQFIIRALPLNPNDGWIEKKIDGSAWVWHKTQTGQEYFFQYLGGKDSNLAHITKISAVTNNDKNNPTLNFSFVYDQQQRLIAVKNSQRQQLSFKHSTTRFGLPQITVTTPIGKYYYFLDRNHNLAQVVYPDGRRFKYVYDPKFQGGDIHNLTSKWQFDQSQKKFRLISQWQYDNQDRAILSQHANGVEKVSIQFDAHLRKNMPANYTANKPVFKNIVTNSLGQTTTYSYQIDGTQFQLLESFGAGCASCGEVNKRYRFNTQGLVVYAADLDSTGKAIRAIDLKYNDMGEVIAKTISGVGLTSQTTTYEYESYSTQEGTHSTLSLPLLTQLDNQNFRRLKAELRPSVVSGKQYRKSYTYNQNNQLIAIKEIGFSPLGETLAREIRYGYDAQGRLSWEDGPLPNGTTNSRKDSDIIIYTYGKNDQLESWNTPYNHSKTQAQYDWLGRVIQYTKTSQETGKRPKIQVFKFRYDSNGRYTELTVSDGNQTPQGIRYYYDDLNRLQTMTDLNDQLIKTYKYDDANRIYAILDMQNGLIRYQRDNDNKILFEQKLTDRIFTETGYKYDDYGRLTTIADSKQGVLSHIDYFSDGVSGRILNQHGDALWLRYNGDGQLQTKWEVPAIGHGLLPPSKTEHISELGRKTLIQDDGTKTIYQYDDFGRLVILDSSIQGKIIYSYDRADRVKQTRLSTGAILSFQYDNYDRLRARHLTQPPKNGLEPVNQTTYFDYLGTRLVKVRDPLQTTEYHYNDQDQLERRVISYQGLKHPLVTYYCYNSKAEPLAMILPDGTQLETSKNKILYRTAPQWQRQTLIEKQDFNDKTSDQKQLTYILGNQLRLSFEYSPTGIWRGLHYAKGSPKKSLSLIKSAYANEIPTLLLSQHWNFNDRHQISHVSDHGLLQDQQKYLYDSKQHVIAHFNATFKPQEMYFYDALGNRLIGQNQQAQQTVQDYHYQSGRLTNIRKSNEQIAIQYNTAGEPIKYPTSQGQLRFSYINGQIAKVWHAQQLIASYQYNDAGQRIKKTIYIDQQQKTLKHPQISYYFYNGIQLAGELNADGRITRQYIYTGDRLLAIMDYAGSGHTPQLEPLTLWQRITALFSNHEPDAQWHYVVNDYMGRPRMVTDQQQHVVWQDQGKALFGESKVIHQGYKLNMRYAGQYADAETGLYYNGYRYYDPATGRYTTPDPLGLAGGENLYGYVNQQPNQYFDPQGLLLFAFDGTGNTDDHVANNAFMHNGDDNRNSNVARFRDTYDGSADEQATGIKISTTKWQNQQKTYASSGQKFEGFYISGAGTTDPYTNLKAINNGIDAGTGGSVPDRVDQMLTYFADYMKQAMANQQKKAQISNGNSQYKQITIPIDVVGFSRGAASARMFSSKLDNLLSQKISPSAYSSSKSLSLVWGNLSRASLKCLGITIDYRFLGVWDTVPALGAVDDNDIKDTTNANMSLSVSNKFAYVAHAVAVNEHRSNFMGRSIYNSTSDAQKRDIDEKNIASQVKGKKQVMIERGFMGAHSDIGGGYNEGDLNKVPLMWMINQAKNIGIHFNDDLIKYRQYGVVSNPVIHDSVGDIKAGTSGGGFGLALMPPGRDFAWSGLNTSIDTYVNQHLTGMTQQQMQALGYTGKYLDPATVNHLKLDWDDTRQFENEKSDKKFSQTARLELAYQQTLRCQSLGITCDELEQYQDLKSLGLDDNGRQKTGDIPGTILYRTDTANEIIQINNYLNWISKNYGTALTTSGRK